MHVLIGFDHTERRQACTSSETIDLRTLEFGLASTRCPSTTSERVTNLHILVPAITRGTLARPHELKRDKNLVVGIVFVDFRKAFDSISHHALLNKFQAVGVPGEATVVNGFQSETLPVKFGVPQRSVLGPTLFSLFCKDLPDTVEDCDGEIHMYADDTTIYVAVSSPDMVAVVLNVILQKLYDWSCLNRLIPHPGKTEYMILMRGQFVGPLQAVSFGKSVVTQVK